MESVFRSVAKAIEQAIDARCHQLHHIVEGQQQIQELLAQVQASLTVQRVDPEPKAPNQKWFTPTEAAAVSAVYAFICATFIYRSLPFRDIGKVLLHAANTSSMLLYIITNAILFNFLLTSEQIPQGLAAWVIAQNLEAWQFLLFVNVVLLLAGQFMEPSSIVLILAPLFLPIARALGIDPIHLGIIMVVNMEIGMITPPVGLNLYVASHLSHMGLTEVSKAAMPFVGVMLAYLMLITYVPEISTFMVDILYPPVPTTAVMPAQVFD